MSQVATVGSHAPDLEYTRPDGSSARLSELWARGPLLTVWLRQCG